MQRRAFLKGDLVESKEIDNPKLKPLMLEKFNDNLSFEQAAHLLKRITVGPSPEQVLSITGKTPDQALDIILGTGSEALPEASNNLKNWLDITEFNPLEQITDIRFEIEGRMKSRYREFIDWWLDQMRAENTPSMEKLTLFLSTIWSIEFTFDTEALMPPPLLFRNNQLLRKHRLGSYKELATEVTLDGSMLLYQSLFYSTKKAPNENYMRELMELFTMGIGNYSEADIREGSKALTGWRTAAYKGQPAPNGAYNTYFSPPDHDTNQKTIFTKYNIAPRTNDDNTEFQVKEEEVAGLVNILFQEKAIPISKFVAEKVYKFFVYSSPGDVDYTLIDDIAEQFRQNSFSLKSLYRYLFTSTYFYDDRFIGAQIKTPPEFVIGLERLLSGDLDQIAGRSTRNAVFDLEQVLYDPPNVGSWAGYRSWLSTNTYPLRVDYAKALINSLSETQLIDFAKKFTDYTNADKLAEQITTLMLCRKPANTRFAQFKTALLNNLTESEWGSKISADDKACSAGIRALLNAVIFSPDFQLC